MAFDFFTVPTVTFKLLYCSFVIEQGRRKQLQPLPCTTSSPALSRSVPDQLAEDRSIFANGLRPVSISR